tara:strand:+ start:2420 stop:3064 length:645 start_codon:yes stop_codon:yes gene_type:complete
MLARIVTDHEASDLGIWYNEYTAVCIGNEGFAHCFGEQPQYDEKVYFLRPNCLDVMGPNCVAGEPLNWGMEDTGLNVYVVDATEDGNRGLDLNDCANVVERYWGNWWIVDGVLEIEIISKEPDYPVSYVNLIEELEPSRADTRPTCELISGPNNSAPMTISMECDLMVADTSGRFIETLGVFTKGTHNVELPTTFSFYVFSDKSSKMKPSVIFK